MITHQFPPAAEAAREIDALILAGKETKVLHGCVWRPEWYQENRGKIDASLFVDPIRLAIFRAFVQLVDEHGVAPPVQVLEVANQGSHAVADVDQEFLEMSGFGCFPLAAATAALGRLRRRVDREQWLEQIETALGAGDFEDVFGRVKSLVDERPSSAIEAAPTLADTLATDPADEAKDVIKTGVDFFDLVMPDGGIGRGEKIALSGPPAVGKTTLALQLAIGALITNPTLDLVWGLGEMRENQLRNKALSNLSRLPIHTLRQPPGTLFEEYAERKAAAITQLRDIGSRFHFVRSPLTPNRIEEVIATTGAGLCVVDYLQLTRLDRPGESTTRRDQIDGVLGELLRIAQARGVAMLLPSNMGKPIGGARDIYSAFKEWGNEGGPEDLDGSGTVDFGDLLIVLDSWGPCE